MAWFVSFFSSTRNRSHTLECVCARCSQEGVFYICQVLFTDEEQNQVQSGKINSLMFCDSCEGKSSNSSTVPFCAATATAVTVVCVRAYVFCRLSKKERDKFVLSNLWCPK